MASSIYPLFLLQRCNFMIQLNPRVNNPAVGTFYVLLSAIFFSLGGFMIKIVPWQSLSVSGVRSIFALITLLLYMKLIHHPFRLNPSVIFGGICSASMSITFVCATKMTFAANAIILQFTHPVFLILILWIFYHKRPDKRAILTCIIALIGIVCFFFDKITSGGMLGNLLAIISGLSYAIMFQMKKMKGGDFESSLVINIFWPSSSAFRLLCTKLCTIHMAGDCACNCTDRSGHHLSVPGTGCRFPGNSCIDLRH